MIDKVIDFIINAFMVICALIIGIPLAILIVGFILLIHLIYIVIVSIVSIFIKIFDN